MKGACMSVHIESENCPPTNMPFHCIDLFGIIFFFVILKVNFHLHYDYKIIRIYIIFMKRAY